jgi:hypothetical protein
MARIPLPFVLAAVAAILLGPAVPFAFFPHSHGTTPSVLSLSDQTERLSHHPPSFAYETDWHQRVVPFATLNTEKCRLCSFESRTSGADSSDNDAVISFATGRLSGLIPFCRSVRTVGCNAQVVILGTPLSFRDLTKSEERIITNCGVTLVSFGRLPPTTWETEVILRFAVIYDYLYYRRHLFGRIFVVDLSQVVFQADPFTPDFSSDAVYFVQQDHKLNDSRAEKYDFQRLPVNFEDFQHRRILSDCVFGGGPEPLLVFLDIFIYYYSMTIMDMEPTSHAAFFMFLVWHFEQSKRFSPVILTNVSGIVSIATYIYPMIDQRLGRVAIAEAPGKYASIILHYSRINKFLHSYYDACPRDRMKALEYLPGVSEGYMNGTLDRFGKPKVVLPPDEEEE